MRKFLFLAIALVAGALAFTSCNPNEPELVGKVYHYKGQSALRHGTPYEHDVYVALQDNNKLTMKLVGVKASEDAKPVTLYLYDGQWQEDEGEYHIHCDVAPQLPDGKTPQGWESIDIDGWCSETECSFDYHINGETLVFFDGEIVK